MVLRTLWLNRNKALYDSPALHFRSISPVFDNGPSTLSAVVQVADSFPFASNSMSLYWRQREDSVRNKSCLHAFHKEWIRDFHDDPFSLFDD